MFIFPLLQLRLHVICEISVFLEMFLLVTCHHVLNFVLHYFVLGLPTLVCMREQSLSS